MQSEIGWGWENPGLGGFGIHSLCDTACRYYKRWGVPEMELLRLPLQGEALTFTHANNTLVISYAKPTEVLQAVSGLLL